MVLSPELWESMSLGAASVWMFYLHKRVGLKVLLYVSAFLFFPAAVMLFEALGAGAPLLEPVKWCAVVANLATTVALIRGTWHEESPSSVLLTEIQVRDHQIAELQREARMAKEAERVLSTNAVRVRQILAEVSSG